MRLEKIYVEEYHDGSFNPAWETKRKDDPTIVLHEYIRKEALLERIDYIKDLHGGATVNPDTLTALDELKRLIRTL